MFCFYASKALQSPQYNQLCFQQQVPAETRSCVGEEGREGERGTTDNILRLRSPTPRHFLLPGQISFSEIRACHAVNCLSIPRSVTHCHIEEQLYNTCEDIILNIPSVQVNIKGCSANQTGWIAKSGHKMYITEWGNGKATYFLFNPIPTIFFFFQWNYFSRPKIQ